MVDVQMAFPRSIFGDRESYKCKGKLGRGETGQGEWGRDDDAASPNDTDNGDGTLMGSATATYKAKERGRKPTSRRSRGASWQRASKSGAGLEAKGQDKQSTRHDLAIVLEQPSVPGHDTP